MQDPLHILQKHWGHSAFRPLQEDIIRSVLDGKDTLALLPTGGGKSICFQVPALATEGICLVVSPLVALMKDQVENLRSRGIKAEAVYSGMHFREIDRILDNSVYGDIRFLYVSPERLGTELFLARMKKMKVNLLAIDEAHCISQWGYDFRPEYLKIGEIRQWLPDTPILALTASATEKVVNDIQDKLFFRKKNVFRKSFERKNIHYHVRVVEDKNRKLLEACKNLKGTGIIYVRNRKTTKGLAELLQKEGISASFYHAGLDHKERELKQNQWKQDKTRVMVCTNAFGMGIDKADVRFVIHYAIPESLEAYYQEAGRAGRDEEKAYGLLLFDKADKLQALARLEQSFPSEEEIKKVYAAVGSYCNIAIGAGALSTFPFSITLFSSRFKVAAPLAYNCLKLLETEGLLRLSEALHEPSRLIFKVNHANLYKFQVAQAAYDPFIKMILRLYGSLFDEYVRIHEEELASKMKMKTQEVVSMLKKLQQYEIVDYIPQTDEPKITYLKERLDPANLGLDRNGMKQRQEAQSLRLHSMIGYAEQYNLCRSRYLLKYFDEADTTDCGQCDICLRLREQDLSTKEWKELIPVLQKLLSGRALDSVQIVKQMALPEDKTLSLLQAAVEHGLVRRDKKGALSWNEKRK